MCFKEAICLRKILLKMALDTVYSLTKQHYFLLQKAIEDHVIGKCMFNEWERKDFRSAEKLPSQEVNKDKTLFWPADEISVRGPAKSS
jgi:hypothetical protein